MSAQLPVAHRVKPKRRKRSNSALDLVARVRKRKAMQRQLSKAKREKEQAARQLQQAEQEEHQDLETEEPSLVAFDKDEVESHSEPEAEAEAEFFPEPEDLERPDQSKVGGKFPYLEPASPARFVKAPVVAPRQKRKTTKTKESVVAIPKDLPKNAVRRRVPDGGYSYFSPKDASKGMGCGKCRFSKRGCMRCSAEVGKDQGSAKAPVKRVAKPAAKPVQRKKKVPTTTTATATRKKVAVKVKVVVPKQKKKTKKESVAASNPKDLPKHATLRRTPEGHAYFSPKDSCKGMGCGKCRFSKRGCMRCSVAVPGTAETKERLTKQPKRSREAACNAELGTPSLKKNKAAKKIASRTTTGCITPKPARTKSVGKLISRNRDTKAKVVANDAQDDGKRVHLLSGEIVDIHVESPISVLDRRRSGDRSQQQSIAQQKNGQEHCFPKLSKFVRPVRIPIKSGCLFGQAEAEAETTGHEEVVGEDTHALLSSKSSNSNNEEKQEHTWKDLNWWNYKDASICNQVKNVLHMSSSFDTTKEEPKIRHEEWTTIKRFILGKLTKGNSGSLYVSGVPGSGKSFIVQQAIASSMYSLFGHSTKKKTKVVHINCMTLQDPRRIFNILLEKGFEKQCSSSAYEKDHRYALSHLRKAVSTASKAPKRGPGEMVIIVLDEIDHLFQNQGNVLYDLFSLAEIQSSNVVLIGIANSIDMTLRMLPHLHTIGVQPAMVNFRAYVHSELLSLMQERLHSLEGPVFGEKAIELCSRKIAAESGDMRQCLNAAYAALEIHISHMKASETSQDGASAPSSGIKKFVDLQHMSLALGKCLKLPLINGMRALPQHQQMILCSHALMKTEGEVLLTSLFSKYSELCKSTKICRLAFNEFENACTSLHDQGLVALNKKANLHSKALKLKVKMSDIVFALQGIRFFHTILNSDK